MSLVGQMNEDQTPGTPRAG